MKNLIYLLRFALLALFITSASVMSAYDFKVNGICYNKTSSNTVEVTYEDIMNNTYTGSVTIPANVTYSGATYKVTAIGGAAFYMCTGLTNVSMPNTITKIDDMAFEKCSGLTSVTIPNSVTTLGIDAFASCTGLTKVEIPNSVKTIGELAFFNCSSMTSAAIGSGVTTISQKAFGNCNQLAKVTCYGMNPPTMKNNNCFDASTYSNATLLVPGASLNSYKVADWWRMFNTIQSLPFDFCVNGIYYKKLTNNTVEVTYKELLAPSYSGDVTIPANVIYGGTTYKVTAIGEAAFYMCTGLTNVSMPNSITSINAMAFEKCSGLTNVVIPNSVTTLGLDAFASCTGLRMINIPNSVTTIGGLAFYQCTALNSVSIGSGVTMIKDKAFYGCNALTAIFCTATTPPTMEAKTCFSPSTYNSVALCVPKSAVNAYKTTDWWRMFITILGMDQSADPCDVNGDGEVNIADINTLIKAILTNDDDTIYDANSDGEVNIADINFVIKAILNQ